jgi:hypothetical protein
MENPPFSFQSPPRGARSNGLAASPFLETSINSSPVIFNRI